MIASSVDENMDLYTRIRAGDERAINEMIERNMPLALDRANTFLKSYRRFRHLKDDMVSEAYLALTTVVRSFVEHEAAKPTGKMVFEIDKRLGNFIDTEIGAGMMSDRSVRRKRAAGDIPNRLPIDMHDPPKTLWQHADGRVQAKPLSDEGGGDVSANTNPDLRVSDLVSRKDQISRVDARQLVEAHTTPDRTTDNDLLDLILSCCGCEEEEMIVQLRVKGYTDEEIGEQLTIPTRTVCLRREQIEERFDAAQKVLVS